MAPSKTGSNDVVVGRSMRNFRQPLFFVALVSFASAQGISQAQTVAQEKLRALPGYERFTKSPDVSKEARKGALTTSWKDEGAWLEFRRDEHRWSYNPATGATKDLGAVPKEDEKKGPQRERGRQFDTAESPDKKSKATYRQGGLWLTDASGKETRIAGEENEHSRITYGRANWVYGEELDQTTAIWWSPDSRKVAFYRFDESAISDYPVVLDQTKIHARVDLEAYMKAGDVNPQVDLLIYDTQTGKTQKIDVRDGKPFTDEVVGHYVYSVDWTPDGKELLFNRTNRLQNIMELCAADPATGKARVVVREQWLASWTDNRPQMQFLKDGKRFIWSSERTGWTDYYLYDLSGKQLATLTNHREHVNRIAYVDEKKRELYYTAWTGDNRLKLQLHRVGLNGKGDVRMTDPTLRHAIEFAPNGRYFVDVSQTHDLPPMTQVRNASGKLLVDLTRRDTGLFKRLGVRPTELLKFKSTGGASDLYGFLHFPPNFDPSKVYPLLVAVYAGPTDASSVDENFIFPHAATELGFLVARFEARSTPRLSKREQDVVYRHLGIPEIDDQAAGVRHLLQRSYVDAKNVGIFGTSYGGTATLLSLLRHPEVFHMGAASSAVTDWRHYDSIYTERYMGLPQQNEVGYDAGSAVKLADKLTGRLMIFYGTLDNNVHPSNSLQLIEALQKAHKSFEVQVGPDQGHASLERERMMEFFIGNLEGPVSLQ